MSEQPIIVVGVDGSTASKEALRWAVRQAQLTGAHLRAVIAWQLPATYGWAPDLSDADFEQQARITLESAIDEAIESRPETLEVRVVRDHAASALVEAGQDAALLVVGSHGHGGFVGMLLGSTSQHCIAHANCSVVVVKPTSR